MRKFLTIFVVFILSFSCFGSFDENIEKMIIKEFEKKYRDDNFFCVQSPYYVEDENRNMKIVAAVYSEKLNENRDIPIVLEINYQKKADIKENLKKDYIETDVYNRNIKFIEARDRVEKTIEKIIDDPATVILVYPENSSDEIEKFSKNEKSFSKYDYIKAVSINIIILTEDIDKIDIEEYITNTEAISLFLLDDIKTVGEVKLNIIDNSYFTETTAKNNILHRIQRSLFYAALNAEPTLKILDKINSNEKLSYEDKEYLLKRFRDIEKDTDQIEIIVNNEDYLNFIEQENTIQTHKVETDSTGYIPKVKIYKNNQWIESSN